MCRFTHVHTQITGSLDEGSRGESGRKLASKAAEKLKGKTTTRRGGRWGHKTPNKEVWVGGGCSLCAKWYMMRMGGKTAVTQKPAGAVLKGRTGFVQSPSHWGTVLTVPQGPENHVPCGINGQLQLLLSHVGHAVLATARAAL